MDSVVKSNEVNSKKPEIGIFMLRDRQPSGFMKEGDDGSLFDELDSPRLFRLASPSKRLVQTPDGIVEQQIRYIKGCNTIIVDEQEKRNIKPSPGDEDNIYFEYGKLIVPNEGETKTLYEFLTTCIHYKESPNRDKDREFTYYRHYPEKVAEEALKQSNVYLKAMSAVKDLYTETQGGELVYKTSKIDFLCNIFNISAGDDYASKTATIMTIAKDNPHSFIKETEKVMDMVLNEVKTATLLNVIVIDKNKVVLTSAKRDIMKLEAKDYEAQLNEITYNFRTTNASDYATMCLDIKNAQAAVLEGSDPGTGK